MLDDDPIDEPMVNQFIVQQTSVTRDFVTKEITDDSQFKLVNDESEAAADPTAVDKSIQPLKIDNNHNVSEDFQPVLYNNLE